MDESFPHYVPKGWGFEHWIVNNELYCGKFLHVVQNKQCSVHFHAKKHETFYVQSGEVELETLPLSMVLLQMASSAININGPNLISNWMDWPTFLIKCQNSWDSTRTDLIKIQYQRNIETLKAGDIFTIEPFVMHRFTGLQRVSEIIEFSTHHDDLDSYRVIKGD